VRLLALVLVLAACGGNKPAPATPVESAPVAENGGPAPAGGDVDIKPGTPVVQVNCLPEDSPASCDALKLMADLAGVIAANKGDCKRLAAAINAWWKTNEAKAKEVKATSDAMSEDEKAAMQTRHQEDMMAIFGSIMEGVGECQEDAEFQEAIKNIDM
jgi:hypothetical protein